MVSSGLDRIIGGHDARVLSVVNPHEELVPYQSRSARHGQISIGAVAPDKYGETVQRETYPLKVIAAAAAL
jgi:hypothetical protein